MKKLIAIVVTLLLSGCFVLQEIDKKNIDEVDRVCKDLGGTKTAWVDEYNVTAHCINGQSFKFNKLRN